jgi:hypothetical protein
VAALYIASGDIKKRGDLPLGKEVPFEEWFVSQQEKGEAQ